MNTINYFDAHLIEVLQNDRTLFYCMVFILY